MLIHEISYTNILLIYAFDCVEELFRYNVVETKMNCLNSWTLDSWKLTFGFLRLLAIERSIRCSYFGVR